MIIIKKFTSFLLMMCVLVSCEHMEQVARVKTMTIFIEIPLKN